MIGNTRYKIIHEGLSACSIDLIFIVDGPRSRSLINTFGHDRGIRAVLVRSFGDAVKDLRVATDEGKRVAMIVDRSLLSKDLKELVEKQVCNVPLMVIITGADIRKAVPCPSCRHIATISDSEDIDIDDRPSEVTDLNEDEALLGSLEIACFSPNPPEAMNVIAWAGTKCYSMNIPVVVLLDNTFDQENVNDS